jgi:protein-tyrosine phosphatase
MAKFGFGPARLEEAVVYGAQRPGYRSESVDLAHVRDWISFVRKSGVRRVCCLLPEKQLAYYRVDLLNTYCEAFGDSNVCHAPIEDYHLCDPRTLENTILPFLAASDASGTPAVVHCSGGLGRTGHVLAAWLVRHRGLSVDDALEIVSRERNPREAADCGYATEKELRCLLAGKPSRSDG